MSTQPGEWKNGLCDCCGSVPDCLIGHCFPNLEACLAANSAGQGLLCTGLQFFFYPIFVPFMRCNVRKQKGIEGNLIKDLAAGWCCPCCASIQIKREFDV